ncbi:DNA-binding protein [Enterococcus faecalis]|nr:DNA-binding protein [Enterococcus faecalis]
MKDREIIIENLIKVINEMINSEDFQTKLAEKSVKKIYNQTEIARIIGVSQVTIRNWTRDGMPVSILGEKTLLYNIDDVNEWIKSHKK